MVVYLGALPSNFHKDLLGNLAGLRYIINDS